MGPEKTHDSDTMNEKFMQMLSRNESVIYTLCLALGDGSAANTRDLFQDVCINLWRGMCQYEDFGKERAWVYSVTFNTIKSSLRRRKHSDIFIPVDNKRLEALEEEAKDSRIVELYNIINSLGINEKQIFYLYLDNVSMQDIAAIVGKSEKSVKQKIYRIKKKIKKIYLQNEERNQ